MKKKFSKAKILLVVAIMTVSVLVIGATYAYFVAQGGATSNSSVRVQTSTTDSLSFSVGSSMNLTADQTSFASGKGNITGSTTATALLTANNATNKATSHYYLYLDISKNELTYTTSSKTAELLLTVTDAAGKTVTSLDGLNYVTSGGVSGFDITTSTGIIKLADNYEISASPSKTDTWKVGVTLVNLDSDQTANSGKTVTATLIIQKDIMNTLAEHVMDLYTTDGENNLYYHTSSLANSAEDNSYRYAGASAEVNNFVCFASTASTCPEDNLYRIIGVFGGKVKLVKYTAGKSTLLGTNGDYVNNNNYYWNYKNANASSINWETSLLNKTNLNTNFLNNIGAVWSNLIQSSTWKIGTIVLYEGNAKNWHDAENNLKNYEAKVALVSFSDYGYAASPDYWKNRIYFENSGSDYRQAKSSNYMGSTGYFWTLNTSSSAIYIIDLLGYITVRMPGASDTNYQVKPVFYLKSSVLYKSGSGTSSDPYRLTV